MPIKKSIRYELNWEIDDENGDCKAEVTRAVMCDVIQKPFEESKFQIHVSKNCFRMYPCSGQETFKQVPEKEYDKLATTARSFYAGVNSKKSFYYWEQLGGGI